MLDACLTAGQVTTNINVQCPEWNTHRITRLFHSQHVSLAESLPLWTTPLDAYCAAMHLVRADAPLSVARRINS
jgi:hypothetical protein